MKSARWLFLSLAAVGCVGQAEGRGTREDVAFEIAEATQLLIEGEASSDVARAYPSLRIASSSHPVDPDLGGGEVSPFPEHPDGLGPISTPVEPGLEPTPDPFQPGEIPGGDPVDPEPDLEGPDFPVSPVDPTMDPVDPEPQPEAPEIPEPGDDAISMTCRQECETTYRTECSTVAKDPILGTDTSVRVCTQVESTRCRNVCDADPPNA